MTTRPGNAATGLWRNHRGKRPTNLVAVTRTDGHVLRFTDSDRVLTFEGQQFQPAVFAGMSAERREAGLRSGNQEAYGIIDQNFVVIPDLLGNRYRGAEVEHVIADWQWPWLAVARHRKWIRAVNWTGSQFVATLEGRTQQMQRQAGGRFGGTWTQTCPYVLGGKYCKAVIDSSAGVRVQTVLDSRLEVEMASASWGSPAPVATDDWYRDGEIEWRWALQVWSRTCTATTTSTALTDTVAGFTADQFNGKWLRITNIMGGGYVLAYAKIVDTTATQLIYAANSFMAGYAAGQAYDICDDCENVGVVSPIVQYRSATLALKLLFPTPFDIAVGDSGIVKLGCDGLFSTCKTKFSNGDNFGGDNLAPSASQVIEPPEEQ